MKKIFFSLVAIAAIAACSKSEVEYTDLVEIGFVPVSKLSTKAAVVDTDYPDTLNMFVFANAGLDTNGENGVERTECTDPYLKNAEFTHRNELSTNVFGGATPYYWPNVKSLWFAGVSKSGNVNNGATPSVDFTNNIISVTDYAPGTGTTVAGDNDLMYFVPVGPFSKAAHGGNSIPVEMKHACSWITVRVVGNGVSGKADDPATPEDESPTWKIKTLKITSLALTGDLTVTNGTTVTWDEGDADGEFGLKTATDPVKLTTTPTDLLTATNAIVIPQAPATLFVEYEYVSQPAQGTQAAIVTTESKSIGLEYNDDAEWLPGYHYTYDLLISAEEILLTPSAAVWAEADGYEKNEFETDIDINKK